MESAREREKKGVWKLTSVAHIEKIRVKVTILFGRLNFSTAISREKALAVLLDDEDRTEYILSVIIVSI